MLNNKVYDIYKNFPMQVKDKTLDLVTPYKLDRYCQLLMSSEYNQNCVEKICYKFNYKQLYNILLPRVESYKTRNTSLEYRAMLVDKARRINGSFTVYFEKDSAEIGYYVSPSYRGKGYGSEMISQIIANIPFKSYGISMIKADVLASNTASCIVLLKNKFFGESKIIAKNGEEVIRFVRRL